MGFLSFLFGSKEHKKSDHDRGHSGNHENVNPENYEPNKKQLAKVNSLLKDAIKLKKVDIDAAIGLLRKAYELDQKYDLQLESKIYTRLPKYLQNAGRPQDASNEMDRLFSYGTPQSRRTHSDLNFHYGECHAANAVIKKKQKVAPYEVTADKCLAELYSLNGLMWSNQENLNRDREIGLELYEFRSKENSKRMVMIENLYPQLKASMRLKDLDLPLKNINVQSVYDAFTPENLKPE